MAFNDPVNVTPSYGHSYPVAGGGTALSNSNADLKKHIVAESQNVNLLDQLNFDDKKSPGSGNKPAEQERSGSKAVTQVYQGQREPGEGEVLTVNIRRL